MANFTIYTEARDTDDGIVKIHTVVDEDGCPINNGHFTDMSDAEYVQSEMETGNYHGDRVSDLSKGMDSWIQI